MRWKALIIAAAALMSPLSAAPRKPTAAKPAPKSAPKPAVVPKLMQSCDAHKFETVIDTMVDGQPRKSKVKLCGVEGQSDADWIKTLRDAIRKLDANSEMAPGARNQIVTAINVEIARISIGASPAPNVGVAAGAFTPPPLSRDYSALPPLPPAREAPLAPAASIAKDFAVLPPLPTPPATTADVPAPRVPLIPAVAPRLTITCETLGDFTQAAPCSAFERETMITVRAGDDIPAGIVLQFVRNGQAQADIALDGLRAGAAQRTRLPAKVCSGFGAGRVELKIVRSADGQVLRSDGPYTLTC